MPRLKHVPGTRFGRLIIVSRDRRRITCRCDCGNETVATLSNLCTGHTTSCGCLRAEVTAERSMKHGAARRGKHTGAYTTWADMLKRCSNPRCKSWPDYGGRGITVCEEWRSFENFLADMGERPRNHTLDREDHNGPYCKANCKWATIKEQNRNTRRNRLLTHDGKTQTLAAWSEQTGIPHSTIHGRLARGMALGEALRTGNVV